MHPTNAWPVTKTGALYTRKVCFSLCGMHSAERLVSRRGCQLFIALLFPPSALCVQTHDAPGVISFHSKFRPSSPQNERDDANFVQSVYVFLLCWQILQLQMNDYRYHYMFTTFVSIYNVGTGS